jgi:tetratricopeptide (TPR) repeat protein
VAEIRRKIAKTWELQGRYEEAAHDLDLARDALQEGQAPRPGSGQATVELARVYGDIGWVAMRQGDYEGAFQAIAAGLDVAKRLPRDDSGRRVTARLQHTLGSVYWRTGDYAQAIVHFQACIEMQERIGDLPRLSGSYNNLAAVYWSQSEYDLAAEYIRKSQRIHERIGNAYGTAVCANNLGVIAYTLGDYARAIAHYERSLEIRREIGDARGLADTHSNLGEVLHTLEKDGQALQYLGEAARLSTELGDKVGLTDTYRLLAEVALALRDVDKALEYARLSLLAAQETGNPEYEGVACRVMGHVHRVTGRLTQSRQCLEDSVETLTTMGNRLELGRSTCELGRTLSAMGLEEGRERLRQAERMFEGLGLEEELAKVRVALAEYWERPDGPH